jgi:mannose-6-phosphate isomerase-like protein (cupin superfamily)
MTLDTLSSPARRLDLAELVDLVRIYAEDTQLWLPRLRFSAQSRWWTRLHGDGDTDVWLLSWLRDQTTELHDHGGSTAAFTVVQGALEEVRIEAGKLSATDLRPGRTQWVAPGVVHDVRNVESLPAVSIHAYSPPLTSMTYYRQDGGSLVPTHTVTGREPESNG